MTFAELEQNLYWAFEQSSMAVVVHSSWSGLPTTGGTDPYAAHHAAAKLHLRIGELPPDQRDLIRAKYGLVPCALAATATLLRQTFNFNEPVAEGMVLCWLNHRQRPNFAELATLSDVSLRTIKRRASEVYRFLDDLLLHALHVLSDNCVQDVWHSV